eukprot:gene6505-16377_t
MAAVEDFTATADNRLDKYHGDFLSLRNKNPNYFPRAFKNE